MSSASVSASAAETSSPARTAEATARLARAAFEAGQLIDSDERISALHAITAALIARKAEILAANARDVAAARKAVEAGTMSSSLVKRLDLTSSADKFDSMVQGVRDVAALADPTGQVSYASRLDDDLELYRVSCPIGVLLVIFEARPEVIVNIAALAIKSGNAAILKGGKESLHTQAVLQQVLQTALAETRLPRAYVQTVETRDEIAELLQQDRYIDLVIPRGSNSLVRSIQRSTQIPVMGHADGICAIYLDESADLKKAVRIVLDAKTSYPAACNAVETLLVHSSLLQTLWPALASALIAAGISLRCDEATRSSVPASDLVSASTPEDYDTEFLSLTLAVASVSDLSSAIVHINAHGSSHTDAIITESETSAKTFCRGVDSAGTYVNASTRFADGFRYGFGTEVGVATSKTHARGPVGLDGLVIYRYQLRGKGAEGHATTDYGPNGRAYKHERIADATAPY